MDIFSEKDYRKEVSGVAFKQDLVLKYCYRHCRLLAEGQHVFLDGKDSRTVFFF